MTVLTDEILDTLVAFPTVSRNGNLNIIGWIESFLEQRGFAFHRVSDPGGDKAGLFASIGPGSGGVMLSAHSDVVPVDGQDWSSDPFRLTARDGRFFGRGACDMKGFLACALAAADRAAATDLTEPFKLSISYDEEIGCVGISRMIDRLASTIGLPRACIVGEPTGMNVITGHKGKATMRATCIGKAGHSSMAPHFLNALHLAGDLMARIRAMQTRQRERGAHDPAYDVPYSTLHVGRMQGGTALNIVPERAIMDFELRHLAQDPPGPFLAALEEDARDIVAAAQESYPGAAIAIEQVSAYPALDTPPDADIVRWIAGLSADAGAPRKVAFGTEAGVFAAAGVPSIVCGPGSIKVAHQPDESIEIAQLRQCDDLLSRILASMSGDGR